MKLTSRAFLSLFIVVSSLLSVPARADSPLGDKMEQMGRAFGQLKKQIGDAGKKDASLALVTKIKENAVAARSMVPPKAKTVPDTDRAEFISDYQAAMDDLISQLDKLATAVRDGKTEDQQKLLKSIEQSEQDSHVTYRKKHKDGGKGQDSGNGTKPQGEKSDD